MKSNGSDMALTLTKAGTEPKNGNDSTAARLAATGFYFFLCQK